MITIHTMPQKSEEWFEAKKGLMSASNATCIGANGAGLETYCKKLSREILGISSVNNYSNADMDRGNSLEPVAFQTYCFEFGVNAIEVGGITNSEYPNVWISPDGLIGKNGGLEIKARNEEKHFDLISGGTKEIPFNQIQMSLLISGRKWWDFVSYNPDHKQNPIFIKRIYPDEKYHHKLKIGFAKGRILIDKYIKQYKEYKPTINM